MRRRPVNQALRGIVVSALAMPLVATQACGRSSKSAPPADAASAVDAAVAVAVKPKPASISGACALVELDAGAYDKSGSGCARYFRMPCGVPKDTNLRGCYPDLETCVDWCESSFRCQLLPDVTCRGDGTLVPDASVIVECVQCASGGGRRPRGLVAPRPPRGRSPLGTYFAELAHLEAASVTAFRDLARTLVRFGAPTSLVRSARRAIADERRHATITRRIAWRFGGSPRRARIEPSPPPSLEDVLLDDVVEGCVGESYGAVVALWQAERASDPRIAGAMRDIARDEAQHASLAWAVLRWGAPRVDSSARDRIRRRVAAALTSLKEQVLEAVDPSVVELAGVPRPDEARELVARFERFVVDEARATLSE